MINELRQLDETLKDIESLLYKVCETDDVSILTREKLEAKIADFLRPQIIEEEEKAQEKAQEKIVSTFFDYMHEFIEKIVVYAPDKSSGHRTQQIDIHFRFNVAVATAVADSMVYDKKRKAA